MLLKILFLQLWIYPFILHKKKKYEKSYYHSSIYGPNPHNSRGDERQYDVYGLLAIDTPIAFHHLALIVSHRFLGSHHRHTNRFSSPLQLL